MKIFNKITVLVTLMFFVPFMILSALFFIQYREKVFDGFMSDTLAAARQHDFDLRAKLALMNDLNSLLTANSAVLVNRFGDVENPPNFYQMSRNFHQLVYGAMPGTVRTNIYRITFYLADEIRPDGNLFSNVGEAEKNAWFSPDMLRRGAVFLEQNYISDQWMYIVTHPLIGTTDSDLLKSNGFIKIEIHLSYFTQYILNDDQMKNFTTLYQDEPISERYPLAEEEWARYARFAAEHSDGFDWLIEGESMFVRLNTLGEDIPMILEYTYSQSAWLWALGLQLIGFAFALMIVLFVTFLLICRKYNVRIDTLVYKMQLVQGGSLSVPSPAAGRDEIAMLDRIFVEMVEQLKQLIEQNLLRQLREKEAQLGALQAQINPHFLYNTLKVIDALALKGDAKNISLISQKLAEIFRYNVDQRDGWFVMLREELRHINNYLFIQRLRFGDRIQVYFDLQDGLLDVPVLKFILQPLVENCFNHAFEHSDGPGEIEISVYAEDGKLYMSVTDNGGGMDEGRIRSFEQAMESPDGLSETKGSIGLYNVSRRLTLAYGEGYGLTLQSHAGQGLQAKVCIPLEGGASDVDPGR